MIVVVTDPSHAGYYGNVVAGPVFKNIADKVYASRLDMHQDISTIYANVPNDIPVAKDGIKEKTKEVYEKIGMKVNIQHDVDWVSVNKDSKTLAFNAKETQEGLVPNVVGMGLQDAIYLLENIGLRVSARGVGKVSQQSLAAGQAIRKGSTIFLELK